jgi:hypothetical protein
MNSQSQDHWKGSESTQGKNYNGKRRVSVPGSGARKHHYLIVEDITASGDRSAVVTGFFSTPADCSVACWRPEEVERFRRHFDQADKEFDEQLAALSRRYARITSQKPAA